MGSFVKGENQYIQLVKVLYCKLPTIGKHLSTFSHKVQDLNHRLQSWEASVLPVRHHGPNTFSCLRIKDKVCILCPMQQSGS